MELSGDFSWIYIIIFIIGALLHLYLYEKKYTKKLELIADKLGFVFSKSGRELTESMHQNFELFSKSHRKILKNEMWGIDGNNNVSIFEYCYTLGNNESENTYKQTVLSIECSELNSPHFELRPKNTFHKIGQVFGYQDINFNSFPIFSKKYLLRGDDENKIQEFFTPEIIKFFESNLDICVEAQGNILIFYKASKRCKPNEIKIFYHDGKTILSKFIGETSSTQPKTLYNPPKFNTFFAIDTFFLWLFIGYAVFDFLSH